MSQRAIAIVVHDFDPNFGHGRYAVELVRHLSDRYRFHVVANSFAPNAPRNIVAHPVRAIRKPAMASVISFLASAESVVRSLRCDLIHAQGLTSWSADLITGHMCNAAKYEAMPPRTWRATFFPKIITPLERRFYQSERPRHLIAISKRFEGEIRRCYGWTKPATLIYHGTNHAEFHPPSASERGTARSLFGLAGSEWVWLFVGEAAKGLHEALLQLPKFPQAKLLVASRSAAPPILEQAEKLGVRNRVVFAGYQPNPVLAYHASDLFIYPSPYDPFGLVVTEAMACGLPVLTNPAIGAAELITHEQDGMLVKPSDETAMARSIEWIADRGRAEAMGQAARQTMLAFSWERCARETAAVYDRMLG